MKEKKINDKVVRIVREDVTDLEVDAFVYYATSDLVLGSGWGTAIAVRGGPSIQEELNGLGPVNTGDAVISGAGEMKAKNIIHAVGPKFQEEDEEAKLRKTMLSALKCAEEKGVATLAFPPMGTGFYGIPLDLSARVMFETIKDRLTNGQSSIKEVCISLMDSREFPPFEAAMEKI
jgi:O-acetyl-ADP-ribose deacetylase (regulator of RNase III)